MGCDIHCYTEKKNPKTNEWEKITGFVADYYVEGDEYFGTDRFKKADSPLDARNYAMFSVLADVLNGYGVAGIDTGDAIKPISEPKGLPSDVCDEIKAESDDWGVDGHSHSYLTPQEIARYNKGHERIIRGVVDAREYQEYLDEGQPSTWCGGVSGPNIEYTDSTQILHKQKQDGDKTYYCQIQWSKPIYEGCKWLFDECLEQLKGRCESKDLDDVRIVFWFDN